MSGSTLALLRQAFEDFERGDIDALLSACVEQVELEEEPELPDSRVWRGHDGARDYFEETRSRWSELQMEPREFVEVGASTVVVVGVQRGVGSISGVEVESPFGHVYDLRGGRIAHVRFYLDPRKALEAAGGPARDGPPPSANMIALRSIFAGFAQGDFASAVASYAPDVEWEERRGVPGRGAFKGLEGLGSAFRDWLSVWEDYRCEPIEIIDSGERVFAAVRGRGRGSRSGIETAEVFFQVWTFKDGKVARIENHREREDALVAAGLRPRALDG